MPSRPLFVDIFPIVNGNHDHQQLAVDNLAKDTVIANAVTPKASQIRLQWLVKPSRAFGSSDSLVKIGNDLPLGLAIKLFEFLQSPIVKPINPIHATFTAIPELRAEVL